MTTSTEWETYRCMRCGRLCSTYWQTTTGRLKSQCCKAGVRVTPPTPKATGE